jgi:hypothetical protein
MKTCNGCQLEKYIYKNVTIDDTRYKLCKDCAFKENLRVQPSKVQIKKVSDKKKVLDKMYTQLRRIQLEKNPYCQIHTDYCKREATEIHHAAGRVGEYYLNIEHWLAVCRNCHSWVHNHPQEARELGFLK